MPSVLAVEPGSQSMMIVADQTVLAFDLAPPVKCHLLTGTGEVPVSREGSPLAAPPTPSPGEVAEANTFRRWWSLESNVPIYLILIMAPLMNFKSATFFTKFNSIGEAKVFLAFMACTISISRSDINPIYLFFRNPLSSLFADICDCKVNSMGYQS